MYEYIQTATGWRLCWGGAALYRESAEQRPPVVPAPDDRTAEAKEFAVGDPLAPQAA